MEAVRDALSHQKENVDIAPNRVKNALKAKGGAHALKAHAFSTPKSHKVASKASESTVSSTKTKRRVLGDISNQTRPTSSTVKKHARAKQDRFGESKMEGKLKPTPSRELETKILLGPRMPSTPKPFVVDDIEYAFGGLPEMGYDASYLTQIRDEVLRELHDDSMRTPLDEYKLSELSPELQDPSSWWTEPSLSNEDLVIESDRVPEPQLDDAPEEIDDPLNEDSGLLDDILNAEIAIKIDEQHAE